MSTFLITVVAVITVGYYQHPHEAALTTYKPGLDFQPRHLIQNTASSPHRDQGFP